MNSSGHSIFGSYLGLIFLVSLPSAILAFYINSRKKSFQGLCPLSVGVLGSYVVNVVQIHLLTFLVMILMILVSYLPPLYLHYTKRNQ